MTCPCRECQERHENCHASCERYGEWKAMKDRARAARAEERFLTDAMLAGVNERKERWLKSMKKRGRLKVRN